MAVHIGFGFPFSIGAEGLLSTKTDLDLIKDSILQILGTNYGERLMRPDFAANIRPILWQRDDPEEVTRRLIAQRVTDAVREWETRVSVTHITFINDPLDKSIGHVVLDVQFRILATNENNVVRVIIQRSKAAA